MRNKNEFIQAYLQASEETKAEIDMLLNEKDPREAKQMANEVISRKRGERSATLQN